LVLVERKPAECPGTLGLTTAGWPIQQGITDHGLGFAIANLVASESHPGTSFIAVLPGAAECATLEAAVKRIESIPHCSARFYGVVSSHGQYVGLETDGAEFWRSSSQEVHTNHFVIDNARMHEGRPAYRVLSEARRQSAAQLSRAAGLSLHDLFRALSFNDGSIRSIAQVGSGRDDRTGAAFVLDPSAETIWVATQRPFEDNFTGFRLATPPAGDPKLLDPHFDGLQ
jgi:hypothetical protein